MRIFWGVLCWMAAASIAFAQAQRPEATVFDDALSIPNGYTEILRFGPAIETVKVVTKGVIAVNALTDHSIAITGEGLGATILFVYGPDGRQIYGARVEVASEPGHRVNVHTKPSTHEYHAYYCTHARCARIKDELEGPRPRDAGHEDRDHRPQFEQHNYNVSAALIIASSPPESRYRAMSAGKTIRNKPIGFQRFDLGDRIGAL